ncbi:MAG: putative sulfate/molybdate transporter [Deltaproteobacteria bacterium]|nr:putative sulfate/molybdate transporter [Deltaproteobacteria bacterium]
MTMRFDRHELAGSLGDLGTLLPLAFGLIVINGVDSTATFIGIGLFYVLAGLYFGVTVPVQPMKVISAYAIASAMSASEITASGLWMGALLLVLAVTGTVTLVGKIVPQATVRGVQLSTGVLLFIHGIKFILGQSSLQQARQSAEPFLSVSTIGPVPVGIVLGIAAVIVILLLLENRVAPAALVVVVGGVVAGLALGGWRNLTGFHVGLHAPELLPFGLPSTSTLVLALTALAIPQIPMTMGNAVLAQADLTREYFGDEGCKRCTPRALAISMGLANVVVCMFGGMPLCHGAGGLAAHYRFGARTAGSNLMIGGLFLTVGVLVGDQAVAVFSLLPLAVLGALLCFAGAQLAMMILDVKERKDLFVVVTMLAVSLVTHLGVGFGVGVALAYWFKVTKSSV